ncbi:hypothetical protein, partial [Burkholderia gladioli]|uniref:hypothetical protein n=1 Tax=Burkholderia gladioli TaxID=28095 RepID=UPI002B252FD8
CVAVSASAAADMSSGKYLMFMEVDREIVKRQWITCAKDLCRGLTSRVVEWGIHGFGGNGRESGIGRACRC